MTDLSQDSMTGEQWVFEERTADPITTEEGERWLRTDLNSGDKLATLRVDVGDSIRDVPIFSTGTAVDTVSEAMRVQVNGVTGYVPIVPVSDAAYPELRMQHNSQVHGYHDRVEPGSAIPDSVLYQWRVEEFANPWPANVGSVDMSVVGLTASTFSNGENSVSGDGTDSYGEADGPQSLPSNQSFGAAATSQASSNAYIWGVSDSGANSNAFRLRYINGSINVEISDAAGSTLEVQTDSTFTDGTPHAIVINKSGNSASDIDIYVDDMATPAATTTNADQAFDHSNYSQTGQLAFWGRNNDADSGTAPLSLLAGDHGVFEFWDSPLDQSDRDGFVSRRPEV